VTDPDRAGAHRDLARQVRDHVLHRKRHRGDALIHRRIDPIHGRRVSVGQPDRARAHSEARRLDAKTEPRYLLARRRVEPGELAVGRDAPQCAVPESDPSRVAYRNLASDLAGRGREKDIGFRLRDRLRAFRPAVRGQHDSGGRDPCDRDCGCASQHASPPCQTGLGKVESWILAQDRLLEIPESLAWLNPELVHEALARVAVDAQGLRLSACAIEREHELSPQALAKRVPGGQRLELGDQRVVVPERQLGVDALLRRDES
jgi:hypothetical protein